MKNYYKIIKGLFLSTCIATGLVTVAYEVIKPVVVYPVAENVVIENTVGDLECLQNAVGDYVCPHAYLADPIPDVIPELLENHAIYDDGDIVQSSYGNTVTDPDICDNCDDPDCPCYYTCGPGRWDYQRWTPGGFWNDSRYGRDSV